ncbi:hypothetical protein OQA88_8123 [Cercophora sp. LCS_1]
MELNEKSHLLSPTTIQPPNYSAVARYNPLTDQSFLEPRHISAMREIYIHRMLRPFQNPNQPPLSSFSQILYEPATPSHTPFLSHLSRLEQLWHGTSLPETYRLVIHHLKRFIAAGNQITQVVSLNWLDSARAEARVDFARGVARALETVMCQRIDVVFNPRTIEVIDATTVVLDASVNLAVMAALGRAGVRPAAIFRMVMHTLGEGFRWEWRAEAIEEWETAFRDVKGGELVYGDHLEVFERMLGGYTVEYRSVQRGGWTVFNPTLYVRGQRAEIGSGQRTGIGLGILRGLGDVVRRRAEQVSRGGARRLG